MRGERSEMNEWFAGEKVNLLIYALKRLRPSLLIPPRFLFARS